MYEFAKKFKTMWRKEYNKRVDAWCNSIEDSDFEIVDNGITPKKLDLTDIKNWRI